MKQFLSQAKRIDSKTFRKCPKAIPKSNGKILLKISSMHLKMRNKKFLPPSDRFSVRSLHRQQPKPLLLQQKSSMIKFTLVPKIKSLTIKTQRPMKKIKSIVFKSKIKPKILGKNSSLILDSTLKKHPLEVIPTTEIESNNKIMIDPLLMAEEDSSANIPISPPHPLHLHHHHHCQQIISISQYLNRFHRFQNNQNLLLHSKRAQTKWIILFLFQLLNIKIDPINKYHR
ncbi:hypothetical protein SSS_02316 [Sarcoptes scabiei]|nr:hypothetical protein SSS_02316 [Sarcoptes scabiei]